MRRSTRIGLTGVLAALVAASLLPAAPLRAVETPVVEAAEVLRAAGVAAPPDGLGLLVHVDYPSDAPLVIDGIPHYSVTFDLPPTGGVVVRNAVTGASSPGGLDGCSDPAFAPTGVVWKEEDIPVKWWFNRASTPEGMSSYKALRAIRRAHQVWPRQLTDCQNAAPNTFRFAYQGDKAKKVGYDGANLVDFGPLDGALAVAYTWYLGTRIVEVDLRFNKAEYRWTNVKGSKARFQVVNVATHEIGHHLGLEDLGDPHAGLTMYGVIGKGEMGKTTLGRGDMKGAETVSP